MLDGSDARRKTYVVVALVAVAAIIGAVWQAGWSRVRVFPSSDTDNLITSNYYELAERREANSPESGAVVVAAVGGSVLDEHNGSGVVVNSIRAEFDRVVEETQRLVGVKGLADTIELRLGVEGSRADCPTHLPSFEGGTLGRDASFVVQCPGGPVVFMDIGIYERVASQFGSEGATDLLRMLFAHEIAHILMWIGEDTFIPMVGESDAELRADCFGVLLLLETQEVIDWRTIATVRDKEAGPSTCQ